MQWTDDAILLSARPHGETGLLISMLAAGQGRHTGLVPGGQSRRHRAVWQSGNLLAVHWHARLSEHLGSVTGESKISYAGRWLDDAQRLAALSAACAVSDLCLPDRQPYPNAFAALVAFFDGLQNPGWARLYVHWEFGLLGALGFGLDLSSCAATGRTEDLIYVSPKSGRAVSRDAGSAYHDRLLPLPAFLLGAANAESGDIIAGMALTGHFLERHVLAPQGRTLPAARSRLVERLRA